MRVVAIFLFLNPWIAFAENVAEKGSTSTTNREVAILAVGNSFTRNATKYLPEIVKASKDHSLALDTATVSGGPLVRHWKAVAAHEANLKDLAGRIYGKQSLRDKLTARKWDFVTIQQYSYYSTDPTTYRPYAANLARYIRKHAPDAEIVIHQTWAYRADDRRFTPNSRSQEEMYRKLTQAYQTIAKEISVKKIIPVGLAFQTARRKRGRQFTFPDPDFDYKNPVFPAVPNQKHSLNVGWRWNKKGMFVFDGHHANARGEYLAAAVWFGFFFDADVRGNLYVPKELNAERVAVLQSVAHDVVFDSPKLQGVAK